MLPAPQKQIQTRFTPSGANRGCFKHPGACQSVCMYCVCTCVCIFSGENILTMQENKRKKTLPEKHSLHSFFNHISKADIKIQDR